MILNKTYFKILKSIERQRSNDVDKIYLYKNAFKFTYLLLHVKIGKLQLKLAIVTVLLIIMMVLHFI